MVKFLNWYIDTVAPFFVIFIPLFVIFGLVIPSSEKDVYESLFLYFGGCLLLMLVSGAVKCTVDSCIDVKVKPLEEEINKLKIQLEKLEENK